MNNGCLFIHILLGSGILIVPACTMVKSLSRQNEQLPRIILDQQHEIASCRMQLCDFKFPLPPNCKVSQEGNVEGGKDTIKGVLVIHSVSNAPLDLEEYGRLLEKNNFYIKSDLYGWRAISRNPIGGEITIFGRNSGLYELRFAYFGDLY